MRRWLPLLLLLVGCGSEPLPDATVISADLPELYLWSAELGAGVVRGYGVLELDTEELGRIEQDVNLRGVLVGLAAGASVGAAGQARITLPDDEPVNAQELEGIWTGGSYRMTAVLGPEGGILWRKGMRMNYVQWGVGLNAGFGELEWLRLSTREEDEE